MMADIQPTWHVINKNASFFIIFRAVWFSTWSIEVVRYSWLKMINRYPEPGNRSLDFSVPFLSGEGLVVIALIGFWWALPYSQTAHLGGVQRATTQMDQTNTIIDAIGWRQNKDDQIRTENEWHYYGLQHKNSFLHLAMASVTAWFLCHSWLEANTSTSL